MTFAVAQPAQFFWNFPVKTFPFTLGFVFVFCCCFFKAKHAFGQESRVYKKTKKNKSSVLTTSFTKGKNMLAPMLAQNERIEKC